MNASRLPFFSDCVGWPSELLPALHHIIDNGVETDHETFVANVEDADRVMLEETLGYDRDFPITNDWHVRYFEVPDLGIHYLVHSAIECVFATREQVEKACQMRTTEEFGGALDDEGTTGPAPS